MTDERHPLLCAWCGRVRLSAGQWEEAERTDLDAAEATHGICPDCLARETRAAGALLAWR